MRLLKDNKGQVKVIEAFFASILLLSALTLIPVAQKNMHDPAKYLHSTASNILTILDENDNLANLIDGKNWTALRSCVQSLLPLTVWYNITVFDENMSIINDVPMSTGSQIGTKTTAIDYICVGTAIDYSIYVVRLQLAVVE